MEEKNSNLPMKVTERSLLDKGRDALPNITDGLKRAGKVAGSLVLALGGLTVTTIAPIVLPTIAAGALTVAGYAAAVHGVVKFSQNAGLKTEPSLLFGTRTVNGEKRIFQDSTQLPTYMKGYSAAHKGALMGLQTLVGFQRYKENLRGSNFELDENGNKVYSQKISTVTHGINIKNLEALETLGYIKIDSEETKFHTSRISELLHREPKEKRSLLIAEKIGFGNTEDLKKIARFVLKRDKDGLEGMKKNFTKITFRLTDKPIDFEELFERVNNLEREPSSAKTLEEQAKLSGVSVEELRKKKETIDALRRYNLVFGKKRGILAKKNIGIKYDRFKRPILDYNPKETFFQKYTRTHPDMQVAAGKKDERAEKFEEELRRDVDLSKFSKPITEIGENKPTSTPDKIVEGELEGKE